MQVMGALVYGLGADEPTCTPLATPLHANKLLLYYTLKLAYFVAVCTVMRLNPVSLQCWRDR